MSKLSIRNPEDTLDAVLIADGDLNVGFFEEAGTRIHRLAFDEDPFYCVDGLFAATISNGVNHLNHHAI